MNTLSVIMCLLLTSKIREENCFSMLHGLLLKVYKTYEAIRCFLFLVSVTTFKLVIMHHLHVKTESHVFFKWTIRVLCLVMQISWYRSSWKQHILDIPNAFVRRLMYEIVNESMIQDLKKVVMKNDKVGINFISWIQEPLTSSKLNHAQVEENLSIRTQKALTHTNKYLHVHSYSPLPETYFSTGHKYFELNLIFYWY